jgi:SAM-dependent methyltransferase
MVAIQGPTGQAGSSRQDGGGEFRTASRQIEAAPAGQRAAGVARPGIPLPDRYGAADLAVFDLEERRRFGKGDPRRDAALQWELLYRLEPELYDRLIRAEPLHPGILGWLPARPGTVVEVGAGTGRLTLPLATRAAELIAVEPAGPLRSILATRLAAAGFRHATAVRGFFDRLPAPDGSADLVVACSSLSPDASHGGDAGLQEMERCCRAGGLVAIVMPQGSEWLAARGYSEISFPGELVMNFTSREEAVELARIFYPHAVDEIVRRGRPWVPYDLLGTRPPRDVAFKRKSSDA